MRLLSAAPLLGLAAAVAGFAFIYSGRVDVAATSPHWAVTEWLFSTAMERAVRRQARAIEVPEYLDDAMRVRAGAAAYDAMCVSCHGAPGVDRGAVAEGLEPEPPELVDEAGEWSAAELFWITKHGVRMTGMPGFGPTHSDVELWEVVAFVERLPRMSAAEYRSLASPLPTPAPPSIAPGDERHGHRHDTPDR